MLLKARNCVVLSYKDLFEKNKLQIHVLSNNFYTLSNPVFGSLCGDKLSCLHDSLFLTLGIVSAKVTIFITPVSAKYKHTCDEYYQAGINETQVMLIDLDGSGPGDPVLVQCEMGHETGFEFFGKTVVEHNLKANTTVRGPMMRDLKKILKYR